MKTTQATKSVPSLQASVINISEEHSVALVAIDDVHIEGRDQAMRDDFFNVLARRLHDLRTAGHEPVLICAGDIGEGDSGIRWVAPLGVPTVYVPGNHEFWKHDYFDLIADCKKLCKTKGFEHIHFLHNDTCVLHGIEFIGSTLWTDLGHSWDWLGNNKVLQYHHAMADFQQIKAASFYDSPEVVDRLKSLMVYHKVPQDRIRTMIEQKRWNPVLEIVENRKAVDFLTAALQVPTDHDRVVVSHHLPIPDFWMRKQGMPAAALETENINDQAFFERYKSEKIPGSQDLLMLGFYCNQLYHLFEQATSPMLWIHGHYHKPINDWIGRTRITSCPVGYKKQSSEMKMQTLYLTLHFQQAIKYVKSEIDGFEWQGGPLAQLRSVQSFLDIAENTVMTGLAAALDLSGAIDAMMDRHQQHMLRVKQKVGMLFGILVEVFNPSGGAVSVQRNDFLLNQAVLGFDKFVRQHALHGMVSMPKPLRFIILEDSMRPKDFATTQSMEDMSADLSGFGSDRIFGSFDDGSMMNERLGRTPQRKESVLDVPLTHISLWREAIDEMIHQILAFKRSLNAFLDYLAQKMDASGLVPSIV